jgi:TDG/mug DNA glycosylase family protein
MAGEVPHEMTGRSSDYDPDILAKGLGAVFCGINPASTAAIAGHNFSSASNRFWRVLHLAGFTAVQLAPQNERLLLEYHCGITAVVRRATSRASDVSLQEFRQARQDFEAKMQQYAPRYLAFLGKRALSAIISQPRIHWGRQTTSLAGTAVWVLPNPSGLNRGFTLNALVHSYSELRHAIGKDLPSCTPTAG